MTRVVIYTGIFALGFLLGQFFITKAYDPDELVKQGYTLAFNTYMLACLEAGGLEAACLGRANDWYTGNVPE